MNMTPTAPEAQKGPTPIQSRALLSQCRDVARGRLRRIAADALQRMEADLFAIAEGSQSREQQNVLFDVIAKVRDNRDEIARTFEKNVGQVFDERVLGGDHKKKTETEAFAENLKLVDDGMIMDSIVLSDMAKRTKLKIEHKQLLGVRARLGHLMGVESLEEDQHNPLGAEAIIEALDRTCAVYAADTTAKRSLLSAFQPYIADGMTDVYAEVNAMLVARNVLPRIKPMIQRAADVGSLPGMSALEAALARTGPNSLGPNSIMGPNSVMGTNSLTGPHSLSRLTATQPMSAALLDEPSQNGSAMSASQALRLSNLGGKGGNGTSSFGSRSGIGLSPEATAALAQIAAGPPDARRQIVRMLAEPSRHSFDAAIGTPATPELVDQLTLLQNQLSVTGSLTQSWLRALDQDVRNQSHPLDQLTIDFVAALFDIIFHDKTISEAVKGEMARMQIVAVKAAIIDRSFFARRQHPMRHFLDRIAECAGDPNLDTEPGSAFVVGLRGLVDDLNTNFADDLTLISKVMDQLEALIAAHTATEEAKTNVDTAAIERAERREIATRMAEAEFKRRLPESVPAFLREFMTGWWTKALVDSFVNDRHGEDAWAPRLALIDELVWTLGPLRSNAVAKLAALLPKLMQGLSRGMAAVEVPEADRKAFFDELMRVHTQVIAEAKSNRTPAVPAAPGVDPAAAAAPKPLPPLTQDNVDLSSTGQMGADFHEHFVNAIEKGALIEFIASDPAGNQIWQRLKLAWISPKRLMFLFTARLTKARQVSRAELVEALSAGTARLVDSSQGYMDQAIEAIAERAS